MVFLLLFFFLLLLLLQASKGHVHCWLPSLKRPCAVILIPFLKVWNIMKQGHVSQWMDTCTVNEGARGDKEPSKKNSGLNATPIQRIGPFQRNLCPSMPIIFFSFLPVTTQVMPFQGV